ncbi:MAG: LPS export ABC transporter ATP-binding protein [Puniceicoccales bacterium]|jgi:lipopolysaccharide export system ATP-binding protein|nr:LPS export ABC transporter ATP-binding protein [Puniceicoccales bacterium]
MSSLRAEKLCKCYEKKMVVCEISLAVHSGEVVGLLGPNGAGKTTTFHIIVGLIPISSGQIFLDEINLSRIPVHGRARAGIGYLPQEASIFRNLTVRDNLLAIAEILKISQAEREHRTERVIEELKLSALLSQQATTLSGGERRRLEIARTLLCEPKFLLFDEPFSGVDPINVQEIQQIIRQLRDRNIGILITDHNVREMLAVVDRAYLIHGGKVLVEGPSDFLAKNPLSQKFYLGENFKF